MAKISYTMIACLQDALRGESVAAVSSTDRERFHVGAVWFGDWYTEHRFGSPVKPKHNAAVSKRLVLDTRFIMAPITTLGKRTPKTVLIPRGMIPEGRQFATSYLLPCIKLHCSRETLVNRFVYRCNLPPDIVQSMATVMNCHRDRK